MGKMIAYCGINCTECPAFIATQADSDLQRVKVAEIWSQGDFLINPEQINCDGCKSDNGRLIFFCQECQTRQCCREKEYENCAYCDDYVCDKLSPVFNMAPDAKRTLDAIRRSI